MKRIIFVLYSLDVGGLERIVVNLVNSLGETAYEPFVCCTSHAGALSAELKHPERLVVIGNRGKINLASCRAVHDLMRRLDIDVVHSHNSAGLLYSYAAAKLLRVPIVHTNHGYVQTERQHPIVGFAEGFMSRKVNAYVCVSRALKDEAAGLHRIPDRKMTVVHNGIPIRERPRRSRARGEPVRIASVGNLRAIKNYPLLIRAFAEIVRRFPGCRLEIFGDGAERSNLAALRNELSLQDAVVFRGRVPDVTEHLRAADVFVLPSLSEGISISVLEALSMQLVCVVSDVGGNPEIVRHGENGFLFRSNDAGDLIEKLSSVVERIDAKEMDEIREKGLKTVAEEFSLTSMTREYCVLYDRVMSE